MKPSKFEEVVTIKVPKGTRAMLQELADRRYLALSSYARMLIMKEIDNERRMKSAA